MFSKITLLARNTHGIALKSRVRFLRTQMPLVLQSKDLPGGESRAENLAHFGYQIVSEEEKNRKTLKVFEDVSPCYDFMNDVLSMGLHRMWRDNFVEELGPRPGSKILDMAGGTGEIAVRLLKHLSTNTQSVNKKQTHVTIGDISQHMLNAGKAKIKRLPYIKHKANCVVDWVYADAENLQFEDNTFTAYTMGFGIKYCSDIDKVLSEAYRVLAPGGRFLCLEFSNLTNENLQEIFNTFSLILIPAVGQLLTGKRDVYQYLVESIQLFPHKDEFARMIRSAGFSHVTYRDLSLGLVSIHSGYKLK